MAAMCQAALRARRNTITFPRLPAAESDLRRLRRFVYPSTRMTTVLEELSGRKLFGAIVVFLVLLAGFFIAGGVGPAPTSSHVLLFRRCVMPIEKKKGHYYAHFRKAIDVHSCENQADHGLGKVSHGVSFYYARIPHQPGFVMSRWFQWLGSSFRLDVDEWGKKDLASLRFDAKVYYDDSTTVKGDKEHFKWKNLTSVISQVRDVRCSKETHHCSDVHFFEFFSCHHKYYLLNLQLTGAVSAKVKDIWFSVIHWQPGFIKTVFVIKTILTPFIIALTIWFGMKIFGKGRQAWLVERLIFYLGVSLCILNFPIDWISLWVDAPGLGLWADIRQGLFYCALSCFWLIFISEQFYGEDILTLKKYWAFLTPIILTFTAGLVYGLLERGNMITNPFFTYWGKESSAYTLYVFFGIVSCLFGVYLIVLVVMTFLAFRRLKQPSTTTPTGSIAKRLRYEGQSYRLKFLLASTLVTILLTGASYMAQVINEAEWKFKDDRPLELSGALYTGVYGLWNLYAFAVMIFYAPAKRKVEDASSNDDVPLLRGDQDEGRRRKIEEKETSL